jgi:hypothetical protein
VTKTDVPHICVVPYSINGPDGVPVTFSEASRLDDDHPAIKQHPDFWAREDRAQ